MDGNEWLTVSYGEKSAQILACDIEAYVSDMGMLVRQNTGVQGSRAQKLSNKVL